MQWLGPPDLKFGISEKHTKFKKIFLMVLTNQLIYLVKNHEEDFFKSCVLLKKSKLYLEISQRSLLILAKFWINHLEDLILMFDYFLFSVFALIYYLSDHSAQSERQVKYSHNLPPPLTINSWWLRNKSKHFPGCF